MNNLNLAEIKKTTFETINSLTIHGIPSLFRSKFLFTKIVWLLLTLTSLGLSIHFILITLNEYFEFNVTTQVRLIDSNLPFDFPTITFCNKNKFSSNQSLKYLIHLLNSHNLSNSNDQQGLNLTYNNKNVFKTYPAHLVFQDFDMKTRRLITKSLDEMLIYAGFDMRDLNMGDLTWIYNKEYGNCYQFNSNGSFKTIKSSSGSGFKLDLLLNDEPIEIYDQNNFKGLWLSIHEKNKNSYNDLDDIIQILPGVETNIILERSEFEKYPKPFSNCESEETLISKYYEQMKVLNYQYSQSICLDFCKYDLLLKRNESCPDLDSSIRLPNKVNCSFHYSKNINIDELERNYINNFYNLSIYDQECYDSCPLECKKVKFTHFVNILPYQDDVLEEMQNNRLIKLNKSFEKKSVKNNLIQLIIKFGSMNYIRYVESPTMNLFDLISNLGGTLGLFLGIFLFIFKIIK